MSSTYPNLQHHYKDGEYLQSKAILASTIEIVDQINDYVLSEEKECLSSDEVDISDVNEIEAVNILTPEFLNTLPNHKIKSQFLIIVSYAMSINKSQGQLLESVGLYLSRPVFSHCQLYIAISRVQNQK
ncbi:hypothetical protein Lal_00032116 [Lupinus albus]|nr:hypothetical protein Lal_00032116 [Lupinus albus]